MGAALSLYCILSMSLLRHYFTVHANVLKKLNMSSAEVRCVVFDVDPRAAF